MEEFGMRNAEFGMKNEENGFVESGTNSYCARAEFTPRGTRAEFGMVLSQMRNADVRTPQEHEPWRSAIGWW